MAESGIDYSRLLAKNLPAASGRWGGFPKYNFIGGHNNPDEIPIEGLIEASARVLRQDGQSLATYNLNSGPLGYNGLRDFLVEKLGHYRSIRANPDEILITSGSNHAIDLMNQVLLEPGDTVITELFTYQGAVNRLRKLQVNVVGVPLDQGGMRMDALEMTLQDLQKQGVRPKYIYTIPTIQNPTGTIMPVERRHELLRISAEYGVPICEDECYADLIWDAELPESIRSLDPSNYVLHIGSFSKNLSPALRLGYILAPWEVLSQMLACKNDGGTGALGQMVVADYFQNNYQAHLDQLCASLKHKLDTLVQALQTHFGDAVTYDVPPGGIFLWVKFPEHIDTEKVEAAALAEGVAFNPGCHWAADPDAARNYLRLCFALASDALIEEGVAKLAQVFRQETGIPES